MIKKTKTKVYDTETATLILKKTSGAWGDPAGYEETLYQTPEGDYFFYKFGGATSPFKKETIVACTKANAKKFLA